MTASEKRDKKNTIALSAAEQSDVSPMTLLAWKRSLGKLKLAQKRSLGSFAPVLPILQGRRATLKLRRNATTPKLRASRGKLRRLSHGLVGRWRF